MCERSSGPLVLVGGPHSGQGSKTTTSSHSPYGCARCFVCARVGGACGQGAVSYPSCTRRVGDTIQQIGGRPSTERSSQSEGPHQRRSSHSTRLSCFTAHRVTSTSPGPVSIFRYRLKSCVLTAASQRTQPLCVFRPGTEIPKLSSLVMEEGRGMNVGYNAELAEWHVFYFYLLKLF